MYHYLCYKLDFSVFMSSRALSLEKLRCLKFWMKVYELVSLNSDLI